MSLKLFDLTGKTALITGSSRGLGLAFAYGLAGAGGAGDPERGERGTAG